MRFKYSYILVFKYLYFLIFNFQVLVFYIIQVFVIFTNVASGMFPQLHEYSRTLYLALTSFLLLVFSSSYNFIFYCF